MDDINQHALSTSTSSLFTFLFTKSGLNTAKCSRVTLVSSGIDINTATSQLLEQQQSVSSEKSSPFGESLSVTAFGVILGCFVLLVLIGISIYRNRSKVSTIFEEYEFCVFRESVEQMEDESKGNNCFPCTCCSGVKPKIKTQSTIIIDARRSSSARHDLYSYYPEPSAKVPALSFSGRNSRF